MGSYQSCYTVSTYHKLLGNLLFTNNNLIVLTLKVQQGLLLQQESQTLLPESARPR